MSNVIQLHPDEEEDGYRYTIDDNVFIIKDIRDDLWLGFDVNGPVVQLGGRIARYERKELARILWAAAYAVDSEQRYVQDEYPARNYDD